MQKKNPQDYSIFASLMIYWAVAISIVILLMYATIHSPFLCILLFPPSYIIICSYLSAKAQYLVCKESGLKLGHSEISNKSLIFGKNIRTIPFFYFIYVTVALFLLAQRLSME